MSDEKRERAEKEYRADVALANLQILAADKDPPMAGSLANIIREKLAAMRAVARLLPDDPPGQVGVGLSEIEARLKALPSDARVQSVRGVTAQTVDDAMDFFDRASGDMAALTAALTAARAEIEALRGEVARLQSFAGGKGTT